MYLLNRALKTVKTYLIPIILGLIAFYLVTGLEPLNGQNILWLGIGEPLTPYLGWEIFRYSPWEIPLGLNPRYGLEEVSSAIVFSDSIPLLAIIFKALSPLLPNTFQYFGLWLLGAFILQAFFAYKIAGLITDSVFIKSCAAVLVLFFPAMLYRMNVHISLTGHFLLLWAIYLNFNKKNNVIPWSLLIFLALGIQFYLFVMVFALWLSNILDRARTLKAKGLLLNIALVLIIIYAAAWQFGYLTIPSGVSPGQGYGAHQANVLSILNPIDWSFFKVHNIYTPRNHEGNNYLGLGLISLVFLAIITLFFTTTRQEFSQRFREHIFLAMIVFAMTLFSFSNNLEIGKLTLSIPLPENVLSFLSIARASGRMLWPAMYLAVFISLWLLKSSLPRKFFLALISVFTLFQVIDTSKGWLGLHDYFAQFRGTEIASPLNNVFWSQIPNHYSAIRLVPPQNWYHRWSDIAIFAAKNNIATSLVYLSRTDSRKLQQAKDELNNSLATGALDPKTIYVFQKWTDNLDQPDPIFNPKEDLFAKIDETTLLAPRYKLCLECKQVDLALEIKSLTPKISPGELVKFSKGGNGVELLLNGWAWPEAWGIWSNGETSSLALPLGGETKQIQFNFRVLLGPNQPKAKIEININGEPQQTLEIATPVNNSVTIAIPKKWITQKFIRVEFKYLNPTSPIKAGLPIQDDRILTLGLESLQLVK